MARVLIVEDEAMLRSSLARGIARLEGVEVEDAGSVDEALRLMDERAPDLIISDIDMPERTGIELLGEIGRRGLRIPIIFVSAYLKAYGALIPRHADIEVLEKPVALEEIRRRVLSRLGEPEATSEAEPFTAIDFLQLAGMGRRSVRIEATWGDGTTGFIRVEHGQVRDARVGDLVGIEAFARIAWAQDVRLRCRAVAPGGSEGSLDDTVDALLLRSAQILDEGARDDPGEESYVERALRYSSAPPPGPLAEGLGPAPPDAEEEAARDEVFERHMDAGVAALVVKDYAKAWAEFSAADAVRPGNVIVRGNLERLRELGYDPEGDER